MQDPTKQSIRAIKQDIDKRFKLLADRIHHLEQIVMAEKPVRPEREHANLTP